MGNPSTRILVVDDELGMREGCSKILSAEGYSVDAAPDGFAALELFERRGDVAVALVDLKMPRMSGLDLIERLKVLDEEVVIFVITAYAAIDTAVEATRRGAYGYIPKPFTPDELLLPVRNGLERRALNIEAKRLREERERRLLEVAVERSKCSTIISCMTDGVIVVNRDRQIVLRNAAAARMLPALAELQLSVPLDRLECEELRALMNDALEPKTGPSIASREVTVDRCVYMANVSPVLEPNGETSGAVAVMRDISALKKLETAKSMFISMVAHEVKSPLAAIEGQLTAVLSGVSKDDADHERAVLERALLRARTLRNLINDLLSLTAIETGHFTIRRSRLNLQQVVASAVDAYREKAEEKEIHLALDSLDGSDTPVLADGESMGIVVMNLIDNAIKYTPSQGNVRVTLCGNPMYVTISVKDDGIGMTPEEKEHAFDEFYRAKNKYSLHIPGTGLGLTLVKRLVELHEGRIAVDSAPGKGSSFAISLPVIDDTRSAG
ncbi:MAG: response regulator [Candidatus Hydrogenedentes bacterium]|nr:response regulator [Candidatus Hydrogenedentota bacterium]